MEKGINKTLIGVIGAGECDDAALQRAYHLGRLIARSGYGLVNGGLGGVMEASARGCRAEAGLTVGILPGIDPLEANASVDIAIPTGLGEIRNLMIVRASSALIAIGGEYGTLSEIALGLKAEKPVIGLRTWDIRGVRAAGTPEEALSMAIKAIGREG
ncbi:MAG: TIGR00725 family protein [Thermodesulfobacteriota bacterium]